MNGIAIRNRGRAAVGVFAATLLSSSAYAQVAAAQAEPAQPAAASVAEVVVTGTRIRRPEEVSNSPITTVGAADIKYQGATEADEILSRLPQFTADENEFQSNGASGTSNINLRNLGPSRVLTLINGQRMLPEEAVDLNFIPSTMIQRVDVVTGGASAVYGSDALSGVVNFILLDHLNGVRFDAQAGMYQDNNGNGYLRGLVSQAGDRTAPSSVLDGAKENYSIAVGKDFADGRANITLYGSYLHSDPVLESSRDVSACALNQVGLDTLACGGSGTTNWGVFTPEGGPNKGTEFANSKDGSKTWVPYDSSFLYNYAPTNYFQREDQRNTAGAFAKYKFNSAAEVYGSFMFMNDHTFSQAAPSALFLGSPFTLNCDNPLMSASQASMLCGSAAGTSATEKALVGYRLNNDPRRDDLDHEDYRFTVGLRGDLGHGFSYDLNVLYSDVQYQETYNNNIDPAKAQLALDAISVNGTPTCASIATNPGCVPINVFQANVPLTAAQAKFLFSPQSTDSRNTETVFTGTINGDLGTFGITSPWATRGVQVALGAEHREETLDFRADAVAQENGTTNADGDVNVTEGFGEIEVPILQNMPFAHELTFDTGWRYSAYHNNQQSTGYSSNFNATTYKAELDYAPNRQVRLRASYNHAIRAPNITELFSQQSVGNVNGVDPCSGKTPTASLQACEKSGATAAEYGFIPECPAQVCDALGGGNKNLKPEVGNTYTVGMVLTPKIIRNLAITVDYYHIKVNNYISNIDPTLIISQCFSSGNPYFCGLFHRDPTTGQIFGTNQGGGYLTSTTLNTGYLETSGIDLTADYTHGIGRFGKLNFNVVGTALGEQIEEPLPGLGSYNCRGFYGYSCGEPNPVWRHVARLTWMAPDRATVSLAWRFYAKVKLSSESASPFLSGQPSQANGDIPAYSYFDLAGTYPLTQQIELRAGINNLFDRQPPAIASNALTNFGNGNTFPGIYDPLGRNIFVGIHAAF